MKLSDIVRYKNTIDQLQSDRSYRRDVDFRLDDLMRAVRAEVNIRNAFELDVQRKVDEVYASLEHLEEEMVNINRGVDALIEEIQPRYFEQSYKWYTDEMQHETAQYILDRKLNIKDDEYEILSARVKTWADWKFPVLCIRPGTEDFVNHLVAGSPLYIVDQFHELLTPTLEKFNEKYQRHIRPYVFKESETEPKFPFLPDNQFGLVFAYNFFNFRPLESIKYYLSEILQKLRPGGVFIFTINNCDNAHPVALCEKNYSCYTPGGMIINLAKLLGYEHRYTFDAKDHLCWIELAKPGELTTLRGGQSLAKIIPKQL
jgi:SAM-dependent methyltransferase